MGKRRNTAKTGDKAIYKARGEADANRKSHRQDDGDDPVYDEVDRYHNEREQEFLRLDGRVDVDDDSEEEDEADQVEAIMDLAAGGSSDDDNDSSDDERRKDNRHKSRRPASESESTSDEENDVSESDDDDDNEQGNNIRAWGTRKSAYYHGGEANLEARDDGDEANDADLEEQAAKEVQALRYKQMSEDDFVLSDADDEEDDEGDNSRSKSSVTKPVSAKSSGRDLTQLAMKEKRKILDKQHPEMLPLLSHFTDIVNELETQTSVATRAIFESEQGTAESVGTTKLGQQYLLTKTMLQSSAALNLAMYLLLKKSHHQSASSSEEEGVDHTALIQSHPVMARLQKINSLLQELEENVEEKVDGLQHQLENLVKAASLLESNNEISDDSENEGSDDGHDDENDVTSDQSVSEDSNDAVEVSEKKLSAGSSNETSSKSLEEEKLVAAKVERTIRRNMLTEAKFGLRPNEIADSKKIRKRRRHDVIVDAGDEDDGENEMEGARRKSAMQALAKTVNSIEQRSATRNRRAAYMPEHLDEHVEDYGELRRGLEMMEAELGKMSDEDENVSDNNDIGDDLDDDDMDNDFYSQIEKKSKSKREARKERYKVQPKFPRLDLEVDGERAISKVILKNRGLVAHKNKLNRNPRVKKREQYRKALIKRKGAVREVRTGEMHQYGGEETGIKTKISRSRKLAR